MEISGYKKSLKNTILDILEKEWPLTAKQIYYSIKKISTKHLTYQAVFKTLKLLVKENVLICDKKEYRLNIQWLLSAKNSIEKKLKAYLLKEMQLKEDFFIPPEIQIEVLHFLHSVGPMANEYIGNDKCALVIVSGGAHIFGTSLENYLIQQGKHVNRCVIDRFSKSVLKESVYGRKIIVVDSGTHTGKTYRSVMKMLNSVKGKYKIKDIKYAAYFDRAGIADWSCPQAHNAIDFMT